MRARESLVTEGFVLSIRRIHSSATTLVLVRTMLFPTGFPSFYIAHQFVESALSTVPTIVVTLIACSSLSRQFLSLRYLTLHPHDLDLIGSPLPLEEL